MISFETKNTAHLTSVWSASYEHKQTMKIQWIKYTLECNLPEVFEVVVLFEEADEGTLAMYSLGITVSCLVCSSLLSCDILGTLCKYKMKETMNWF